MNHNMSGLPHQHSIDSSVQDSDRGRSRKKRDFFGTLRRRLGRSKNRTKSVDRGMIPISAENPHGETRSISADRGGLTNSSSQGNLGDFVLIEVQHMDLVVMFFFSSFLFFIHRFRKHIQHNLTPLK